MSAAFHGPITATIFGTMQHSCKCFFKNAKIKVVKSRQSFKSIEKAGVASDF
jgi:hypothetical protein